MNNNLFINFLLNYPLYKTLDVTDEVICDFFTSFIDEMKVDIYCPDCNDKRIFTMMKDRVFRRNGKITGKSPRYTFSYELHQILIDIIADDLLAKEAWEKFTDDYLQELSGLVINFQCSLNETHYLAFIVKVSKEEIVKIGQYPSFAQANYPLIKKFRKVLSNENFHSLSLAISLFSDGVGIGAYAYLRRVFESLVEEAVKESSDENNILNDNARMKDKILFAREHLPDFLVNNQIIYGIVSKGLHELSEEECLKYFPVLRDSIFLILEEKIAMREKENLKRSLTHDLNSIASSLK